MRILHIIDSLGLGGAQTVVRGIFEAQKENKDIFLLALRKRKINIEINHSNVIIYNSNKKYSFKPLKKLKNLIEKEKIEVLHCHLFKSQVFGYILKKKYFPNIKLIFHEHGEIFQKKIIYNNFMKFSKNKVDSYLAVSNATREELIKNANIPSKKIKVLYNFVDLDKFNIKNIKWDIQKEKEKLGINDREFVIGFVGRLSKEKGCEYLIKALPNLNFKYRVLIAGDGNERSRLQRLARDLKVENKITFLGYIKDTLKIYSLLNILIIPSISEASPMILMEARAMKIPIISSDIKQIKEFGTSLKFKCKDYRDLANKVQSYYSNKKNKDNKIKIMSLKNYINKLNKFYAT